MVNIIRPLRRFLALPEEERQALPALAVMLAAARLGVLVAGIARARQLQARLALLTRIAPERMADLVRMASTVLPGPTLCLPRALVLEAMLLRARRSAVLRIGVAPLCGRTRPEAHAWVELDGAAVGENPSRYTALPLFGAQG